MFAAMSSRSRAARQPVQPGHRHHVAGTQVVEHVGQLRPVAPGPGDHFGKNSRAAGRMQLGPLVRQVLVTSADPGIAQQQMAAGPS